MNEKEGSGARDHLSGEGEDGDANANGDGDETSMSGDGALDQSAQSSSVDEDGSQGAVGGEAGSSSLTKRMLSQKINFNYHPILEYIPVEETSNRFSDATAAAPFAPRKQATA